MEEDFVETLKAEIEDFGITLGQNDEKIFLKCASLCNKYGLGSSDFVESWLAFAASKSINELGEKDLDLFEKQSLSARKEASEKTLRNSRPLDVRSTVVSKVQIFGQSSNFIDSDNDMENDGSEVLEVYGLSTVGLNTTPKLDKKPTAARLRANGNDTPKSDFSPAGFSPAVQSMSEAYGARTKAGDSVLRYKCKDSEYWNEIQDTNKPVKVIPSKKNLSTSENMLKYMFQKTTDIALTLNAVIEDAGLDMMTDGEKEPQDLRVSSVEEGWYLGRIRNDEGRLSQGNIYLEGDTEVSGGHIVSLDLSLAEEYRLFPGQVVMVKGKNELGKCLRVSEISVPSALPLPEIIPNMAQPLNMLIASGPFTPVDSLAYEPLTDLLEVIKRDKPNICFLVGPFVDPSHPLIANGEVADTFDDMFENMLDKIKGSLENVNTRIVLVPSSKDAHHHFVYPTPQYVTRFSEKITKVPDPAIVEVGGVTVCITSVDILRHLGNSELAKSTITDRLGGLSKLILSQRNFYPLYPPDESVPFDVQLWSKYCKFTHSPHLLILPSDLRYFVKEVEGTIVVNPERLTKGKSGGTYARIQVKLPEPLGDNVNSVADYCCGEIMKI